MFRLEHIQVKDILHIDHLIIPEGITCIVGESGAGKSTLLRLLNKMMPWNSGEIYYRNTPLKDMDAVALRRRVVMLAQQPVTFPGDVRESLLAGRRFAEMADVDDANLKSALRLVALEKTLEEDVTDFSGGEKQRLALARALLLSPEVLLLDEPTSALDNETEHRLFAALTRASVENHCAIVMVTHAKALTAFAQTRIELHRGEVVRVEGVSA